MEEEEEAGYESGCSLRPLICNDARQSSSAVKNYGQEQVQKILRHSIPPPLTLLQLLKKVIVFITQQVRKTSKKSIGTQAYIAVEQAKIQSLKNCFDLSVLERYSSHSNEM